MLNKIIQKVFNFRLTHCRRMRYICNEYGNVLPAYIDVLWEKHYFKTNFGWTPTYAKIIY